MPMVITSTSSHPFENLWRSNSFIQIIIEENVKKFEQFTEGVIAQSPDVQTFYKSKSGGNGF